MNNDNLPLYTAFLAVVRAGSILEASRQLYISWKPTSEQLFSSAHQGESSSRKVDISYMRTSKMHLNISKPEKMVSHHTTVHRPVISASAPAQHYANIYCFHTLENIQHRIRRLISQLNVSQAMTQ